MSFLEELIKSTQEEITAAKRVRSLSDLKKMIWDGGMAARPFADALRAGFGLIAELKKRSPSGGNMRPQNFNAAPKVYAKSSVVRALSVLTNATHFGMGIKELARIRNLTDKPLLRKDFILEEYQVYEARAFGADGVLLMACVLEREKMAGLADLAWELGLEPLFEVHNAKEIEKLPEGVRVCGVNSRNFAGAEGWQKVQSSKSNVQRPKSAVHTPQLAAPQRGEGGSAVHGPQSSPPKGTGDPTVEKGAFELVKRLPAGVVKVAESGVRADEIGQVRAMGYHAVLVGTSLLKHPGGVAAAVREFEKALGV